MKKYSKLIFMPTKRDSSIKILKNKSSISGRQISKRENQTSNSKFKLQEDDPFHIYSNINFQHIFVQNQITQLNIYLLNSYQITMDDNYQDEQKPLQNQYGSVAEVQLNRLIHTILGEASKSNPLFPAQLSKKTCEQYGLQSSDNVFYNLMSNIVQYSLNDVLSNAKEARLGGKYKKQAKDSVLKTVDVQKLFESKDIFIAKPRMYPQISVVDQNTPHQKMETQ